MFEEEEQRSSGDWSTPFECHTPTGWFNHPKVKQITIHLSGSELEFSYYAMLKIKFSQSDVTKCLCASHEIIV